MRRRSGGAMSGEEGALEEDGIVEDMLSKDYRPIDR